MNASANRFEPASLADSVPYRALSHPLDNVIWNALTSRQCGLAEGDDLARRYDPAFARFGALADMSSAALNRARISCSWNGRISCRWWGPRTGTSLILSVSQC